MEPMPGPQSQKYILSNSLESLQTLDLEHVLALLVTELNIHTHTYICMQICIYTYSQTHIYV